MEMQGMRTENLLQNCGNIIYGFMLAFKQNCNFLNFTEVNIESFWTYKDDKIHNMLSFGGEVKCAINMYVHFQK
jgi:hypothetical protein